jgi:hypothetical protein
VPDEWDGAATKADTRNEQIVASVEQNAVEDKVNTLGGNARKRSTSDRLVMGGLGNAGIVKKATDTLLLGILGRGKRQGTGEFAEMGRLGLGSAGGDQSQGIELTVADARKHLLQGMAGAIIERRGGHGSLQ